MERPGYYVLRGKEVVASASADEWSRMFEDIAGRTVAKTVLGAVSVSTVFLGLDHSWGEGPPLLFETMIFGGDRDGEIDRYSTWAQAELGHMELVESLETLVSSDPR